MAAIMAYALPHLVGRPVTETKSNKNQTNRKVKFIQCGHIGKRTKRSNDPRSLSITGHGVWV